MSKVQRPDSVNSNTEDVWRQQGIRRRGRSRGVSGVGGERRWVIGYCGSLVMQQQLTPHFGLEDGRECEEERARQRAAAVEGLSAVMRWRNPVGAERDV